MRDQTAAYAGIQNGDIRAIPAEIGGGFGGKTKVYLEPVAMMLSKKAGRPVKMVMTREEVFRASGPAAGTRTWVKIGARKDGTITAVDLETWYQSGAFPGGPFVNGCLCAFSCYGIPNQRSVGYEVVSNRPMVAAYCAPGAPQTNFAVESALDVLAKTLAMDPADLRLKNVIHIGDPMVGNRKMTHEGFSEILETLKAHPAYKRELGPNQGRGFAAGFWHNTGGDSGATAYVNPDGTVTVATGSPDIGGSRASMALMAADTFGIPYEKVRAQVNDTTSVPYTFVTGGSRVTFASGKAVVSACSKVVQQLKERAAKIWQVEVDGVDWIDGEARPSSSNIGEFESLTLKELAQSATATGGHFGSSHAEFMTGHAPGFSAMFIDVEVDPETGRTTVLNAVAAGRGPGDPSRLCRGSDPGRGRLGRRLGAERRLHLRPGRGAGEPELPRLLDAGRLGPADDRGSDCRGAEPLLPLRRQGRGRGGHGLGPGRRRQRRRGGDPAAHDLAADRAAEVARRDRQLGHPGALSPSGRVLAIGVVSTS